MIFIRLVTANGTLAQFYSPEHLQLRRCSFYLLKYKALVATDKANKQTKKKKMLRLMAPRTPG